MSERLFALSLLVLTASCASTRTVAFEANRPARVDDVCERMPCRTVVSRETCWLMNSSSRHIGFVARSEDGIVLASPMLVTCDIGPATTVRFVFPAPADPAREACGVEIFEAGTLKFRTSCRDALRT